MSGHIGLREESRAGHLLARRIARLFAPAVLVRRQSSQRPVQPVGVQQ